MTDLAIVEDGVRVDIGECGLDSEADIALDEAYADLDPDERTRAAAFVFERDRERFVRAHGFLRRQLGAFLGVAPRRVPIAAREGGKPFLRGHRASFNLSHSGARAVVAIARDAEIGIDLETLDRADSLADQLEGLIQLCLVGEERRALHGLTPDRRIRRFLSYWTAKEARMKLTGEGMSLEPREIALKLRDGVPIGYLRPRAPKADLRFVPLASPDAICCLAVRRDRTLPHEDWLR